MATIDLTDLEVEETTDVLFDDKNGNPLLDKDRNRRSATVYGPATLVFVAAKSRYDKRTTNRIINQGGEADAKPMEDVEAVAVFLSEITKSLNNFGLKDEDQVQKTFYEVYSNLKVGYLAKKVNVTAGNWANF